MGSMTCFAGLTVLTDFFEGGHSQEAGVSSTRFLFSFVKVLVGISCESTSFKSVIGDVRANRIVVELDIVVPWYNGMLLKKSTFVFVLRLFCELGSECSSS